MLLRLMASRALCSPNHHGADAALVGAEGVLAEGFGPEAVAVAVVAASIEADVPEGIDELFYPPQILGELAVGIDAEAFLLEGSQEAIGQFLFDGCGLKRRWLDLPAELVFPLLGRVSVSRFRAGEWKNGTECGGINRKERKERREVGKATEPTNCPNWHEWVWSQRGRRRLLTQRGCLS